MINSKCLSKARAYQDNQLLLYNKDYSNFCEKIYALASSRLSITELTEEGIYEQYNLEVRPKAVAYKKQYILYFK